MMRLGFRLDNPGAQATLMIEEGEFAGKALRLSPPILSQLVTRLWQSHENLTLEARLREALPPGVGRA